MRETGGAKCGYSFNWDATDRCDVMAANAEHWKRWKRERGWVNVAVGDIPGFVASVQELHDYGYSLTDIGAFFGVSRERVRQWFGRVPGLEQNRAGRSLLREWDWDAECFLPVTVEQIKARRRGLANAARDERHDLRRAAHVRELKRLAGRLGRVPRTGEFCDYINAGVPTVAHYWGRHNDSGPYTEYLDALWAAAGMKRAHLGDWNRNESTPDR